MAQLQYTAKLETGEGLVRNLAITVPAAEVDKAYANAVEKLALTMKVPGFRPGHVPAKVVKEKAAEQLAHEVAEQLMQASLNLAVSEHKLNIAGQPHVHAAGHGADDHGHHAHHIVAKEGEDFAFTAHLEVFPEFEPKGFEGLNLEKPEAEPTDELVTVALNRLAEQMQTFEPKTGKAAKGDRVTMTGQGFADDVAFPGGNLQDFKVVLGSGSLIPGFEEGLLGTKAGDEVDLNVSFPADYHAKELAGKPAVFKLKIDAIEAPKTEPLTDESAKQFGFDNLEALKDVLKKGAVRDLAMASEQQLKRQLLDALEAANQGFALPQGLVAAEHQALWRAQLNELRQKGLPMEALGDDIEKVVSELKPLAERRVRLGLTLAAIAKKEQISVQAADVEQAVAEQVRNAGPRGQQVAEYFQKPQNRQQLLGPLLEDKVTAWVLSKAKITSKPVEARTLLGDLQ
jgi:trigger factor